jgi:ribosome-binding factor A
VPREFSRNDRVADAVQRELADLLRQEINDPRLAMINITGVDVSRDLAVAKVFINFIQQIDEDERRKLLVILAKAKGFIRLHLTRRLRLRMTPQLTFIYDDSGDRGRRLSTLIDQAVAQDKQSARHDESN